MGYYTRHEISVDFGKEDPEKMRETVCTGDYEYTLDDLLENNCDDMKWYDHKDDMKAFSKKFPTALITLTGYGEESGDVWREYYLGGKCQEAETRIIHDEFDKKKLR